MPACAGVRSRASPVALAWGCDPVAAASSSTGGRREPLEPATSTPPTPRAPTTRSASSHEPTRLPIVLILALGTAATVSQCRTAGGGPGFPRGGLWTTVPDQA